MKTTSSCKNHENHFMALRSTRWMDVIKSRYLSKISLFCLFIYINFKLPFLSYSLITFYYFYFLNIISY
ncbi:hypothetical protein HanRHA438_Chr00c44g0857741 [Helianthus annuus]|nr:hypothetical protein HanRHA438_Chr00c44g0857741 [Helianthus annuus]